MMLVVGFMERGCLNSLNVRTTALAATLDVKE